MATRYKLVRLDDDGSESIVMTAESENNQSLSIKTSVGTLRADAETAKEGGYDAVYLHFIPDGCPEGIDIARLRHQPENDQLQLDIWADPESEDPTQTIMLNPKEIAWQL